MTEYTLVRELSKVYDALYDKLDGASGTLIHNKGLRSPSLRTLEGFFNCHNVTKNVHSNGLLDTPCTAGARSRHLGQITK